MDSSKNLSLRKIFYFPIWLGYGILQIIMGILLWPCLIDFFTSEGEIPPPSLKLVAGIISLFTGIIIALPTRQGKACFEPNLFFWNSLAFIAFVTGFGIWSLYENHYTERFYGND